ncbi:MAG: hypothetical protein UU88_C0006G0033 [Parcubacteria group bacterium GW2011_GWC1_42_11]|uniref:Uncharacterized protein n=1 Tax=Candidatus Nomurabacteria bacterium GW2011_GWC2_42_20 TaxID=1618756 RepID=A0A0G1BLQ1_9BACT|nr:MAG: hypothetical protein UU88_C0006G0033 [Parcubacteria group bacterium GW2011_GWC1_42_11]KKS47196.1 MAG: hypothetical protein UV12_C0010G0013 [Candidatus Nomurabacteria bacterium GW2011_GWC2_42_20]KKS59057.1 MAG: hypothetical protein UV24_C0008G0011 [Candidatus Nomurabacteria bacterium GW2011_GWA2_42_41]KKT09272.1 MAG: hypothetical protein UV86_C0010G0013 [Candidatus Nomurabacteria bacterium GW2011_GWB1_43_20]TAN36554.1 MAG: hypothetical protein EPN27_00875 [Patescibacteria group bacterium
MKHIGTYIGLVTMFAIPTIAFSQTVEPLGALQEFIVPDDPSNMLETISLWSLLIVASVTSAMVWIGGRHMHGGVFGSVLTFFSIGMTLVFLGFATEVPWFESINHTYLKVTHDSLYTIGYVFMGVAASKLLKVIKGE